jgi:hypothetical protein
MKSIAKIVALGALLTLAPAMSASAQPICGFGNRIWEGHDGIGAKALQCTTNFWTYKSISTTFEISGCDASDNIFKKVASQDQKIYDYANRNLDHLAVDMARGQGEHVDVLAHLLGLPHEHTDALRDLAQQNFATLFPHDSVTTRDVLVGLSHLMVENPELSDYVTI